MLLPQRTAIDPLLQLIFGPRRAQTTDALDLLALVSQLFEGVLAAETVHPAHDHGGQSGVQGIGDLGPCATC
jgi:hypothetical protein